MNKIDKFYSDNYERLINYVANRKRGADKVNVTIDAASEVVHDTYIYHRTHPQHFNELYIWHLLKQRRLNYIRNEGRYDTESEDFFHSYYSKEVGIEHELSVKELKSNINKCISEISNDVHKAIAINILVEGGVIKSKKEENVITRFKSKMVERYGDLWEI